MRITCFEGGQATVDGDGPRAGEKHISPAIASSTASSIYASVGDSTLAWGGKATAGPLGGIAAELDLSSQIARALTTHAIMGERSNASPPEQDCQRLELLALVGLDVGDGFVSSGAGQLPRGT